MRKQIFAMLVVVCVAASGDAKCKFVIHIPASKLLNITILSSTIGRAVSV